VFMLMLFALFAGCSKPSAEEYFAEAEQAQRTAEASLGNSKATLDSLFTAAISSYEKIVEEYPDDPLAEVALFRIAELYNNGTRSFQKAIDTFRRYLTAYPDRPQAAVSLFMIAFLYNNELQNLDSATAVYGRFLKRFPDHELASSARAESENIGKSPEQIIEQQLAMSKGEEAEKIESAKKR